MAPLREEQGVPLKGVFFIQSGGLILWNLQHLLATILEESVRWK